MKKQKPRIEVIKELLTSSEISTQEELAEELERRGYAATQSTISRELRKVGAVKATTPAGGIVYRLPQQVVAIPTAIPTQSLADMMLDIQHNGSMIVMHTTPGSASLVARFLDETKPAGILGTIAGDDTIFVAPASTKKIDETVEAITSGLGGDSSP